jgi:hypothetical protein
MIGVSTWDLFSAARTTNSRARSCLHQRWSANQTRSHRRSFAVSPSRVRRVERVERVERVKRPPLQVRLNCDTDSTAISDVVREKVPAWCNDALVGFGYRDPRGLRALRPLYRHDIGQYGRRQRGPCSLRLARSVGFQTRRKKQKEGLDDYDV